jgi:hypothetical protein
MHASNAIYAFRRRKEGRYVAGLEAIVNSNVSINGSADATQVATTEAWTKYVYVKAQIGDVNGDVIGAINRSYATTVSVTDDSTAGTATIGSTTLTFVNGVATIAVNGDAAAWLVDDEITVTIAEFVIGFQTIPTFDIVVTIV